MPVNDYPTFQPLPSEKPIAVPDAAQFAALQTIVQCLAGYLAIQHEQARGTPARDWLKRFGVFLDGTIRGFEFDAPDPERLRNEIQDHVARILAGVTFASNSRDGGAGKECENSDSNLPPAKGMTAAEPRPHDQK